MDERHFGGLIFSYAGPILPVRDDCGNVIGEMPQARYRNERHLPLHRYGGGPFCKFLVAKSWKQEGVYVLAGAEYPLYIGECQSLEARWGANGYGAISPRACYKGGQQTNCRINNLIYRQARAGAELYLWFRSVDGGKPVRADVEDALVACLRPSWNR